MESGLEHTGVAGSIVSLADLRSSGMTFEWYDALAITLQLCQGITESTDSTEPSTLHADTVFIGPAGEVIALVGPQHPAAAIPRVTGIFSDMLPDFHRRSTFRAVIAEATSVPPGYASIGELAEALAQFERPNRVEIVQTVYRRWQETAGMAASDDSSALDVFLSETTSAKSIAAAPIPKAAKLPRVLRSLAWPWLSRGQLVFLFRASALAVVVMVIVGLGVWALQLSGRAGAVTGAGAANTEAVPDPQASRRTLAGAERAIGSHGPSSRAARVPATAPGSGALQSLDASSPTAPAIAPDRLVESDRSVQAPRSSLSTPEGSTADPQAVGVSPTPESASAAALRQAILAARYGLTSPAPGAPPPSDGLATAAATFSASDPDVVPPVPDSSQQLWRMPASTRQSDLAAIEIVVDERGAVESARAKDYPDSLADATALTMSLSAVKSWHFSPALKDGHPVKFRQLVLVTMH